VQITNVTSRENFMMVSCWDLNWISFQLQASAQPISVDGDDNDNDDENDIYDGDYDDDQDDDYDNSNGDNDMMMMKMMTMMKIMIVTMVTMMMMMMMMITMMMMAISIEMMATTLSELFKKDRIVRETFQQFSYTENTPVLFLPLFLFPFSLGRAWPGRTYPSMSPMWRLLLEGWRALHRQAEPA
jgi:hypothetical protein